MSFLNYFWYYPLHNFKVWNAYSHLNHDCSDLEAEFNSDTFHLNTILGNDHLCTHSLWSSCNRIPSPQIILSRNFYILPFVPSVPLRPVASDGAEKCNACRWECAHLCLMSSLPWVCALITNEGLSSRKPIWPFSPNVTSVQTPLLLI